MPPRAPLSPNQLRLRVMVISFPFLVASSVMMFKRLYLGEEQKKLPRPDSGETSELKTL